MSQLYIHHCCKLISKQNHVILLIIPDVTCIFGYQKSIKVAIKNTKCEECPI